MARVDDLSRSLVAFDGHSTLVGVIEMSQKSWLVGGLVPGVERRPLKKLKPDGEALLKSDNALAGGGVEGRADDHTGGAGLRGGS